jgi:hypothetical protein
MLKAKFIISLILVFVILFSQAGGVFAASALQSSSSVSGIVQRITLETDPTTGVTIVIVDLIDDNQTLQSVRVSQKKAIALGLVVLNGDGKPGINSLALGKEVELDPESILPAKEEGQHPVGNALATFFSDIEGVNYESIMTAREQGAGFGIIAQTLWLTKKLDGNGEVFKALLKARQTGDYGAFLLEDGSTPKNWEQLKRAILEADNNASGAAVIADPNENGTDIGEQNNKQKDKEKNNPGNNKDKDQVKEKDKEKDKKK